MSLSTALNIAQNSLLNTQRQTSVVARNIANEHNPDYARRSAILSSLAPGSQVAAIRRATDAALFKQNMTALSGWTAQSTITKGLDQLTLSVNGIDNQTSPAMMLGALQDAIQLYSATPSNRTLAENAVEAARQMARTLNDGTQAIQNYRADIDGQIATAVGELNALLSDFETVNKDIVKATAAGRDAHDSFDRRDALLKKISEYLPISTIPRANNDMMIVTADGTTLFETVPRHVGFEPTPAFSASTGGNRIFVDGVPVSPAAGANTTAGGTIAAMVQLRDTFATGLQAQLDEIARGLVEAFAETDPSPPGDRAPGLFVWNDPSTMPAGGTHISGLAGLISVNAAADSQKGGDPERLRDGIVFDLNPGSPQKLSSFNDLLIGFALAMDAPIDFVTVDGTTKSASLMTYSADAIGWIENARKAADGAAESKAALVVRTTEALSNAVNVNIDEETALLLQLEQSYAASAKLLQVIDEMLRTLLSAVR